MRSKKITILLYIAIVISGLSLLVSTFNLISNFR